MHIILFLLYISTVSSFLWIFFHITIHSSKTRMHFIEEDEFKITWKKRSYTKRINKRNSFCERKVQIDYFQMNHNYWLAFNYGPTLTKTDFIERPGHPVHWCNRFFIPYLFLFFLFFFLLFFFISWLAYPRFPIYCPFIFQFRFRKYNSPVEAALGVEDGLYSRGFQSSTITTCHRVGPWKTMKIRIRPTSVSR